MRIANYRDDLLWSVSYLLGIDPKKNLDDDYAASLNSFINAFVRRTFDVQDWPEWCYTGQFQPNLAAGAEHIVSWNASPSDFVPPPVMGQNEPAPGPELPRLGRVFKVYLVNPMNTPFKTLDTPFTLRPEGVHCGFEHGPSVWIKFIDKAPQFTSVPWRSDRMFNLNELTYSPITGQCYKSLANGNQGHDPADSGMVFLPTEIVQEHVPPNPGLPASTKLMQIGLTNTKPGPDPPAIPPSSAVWNVKVTDEAGTTIATVSHTATGSEALTAVNTNLVGQLSTALPTFVAITADNSDPANPKFTIEDDSNFKITATWLSPFASQSELNKLQVQSYIPAVAPADRIRQITNVTLPPEQAKGDTLYTITIHDAAGGLHTVTYQGLHTDSSVQILNGLNDAIQSSSDPYLAQVFPTVDTVNSRLALSSEDEVSVIAMSSPSPGIQILLPPRNPVFSPRPPLYRVNFPITVGLLAQAGAIIIYTLNDPAPVTWTHGTHSTGNTVQIVLNDTTTIRAVAAFDENNLSPQVEGLYSSDDPALFPPRLIPPSGHGITFPFHVSMSVDPRNLTAELVYTTDPPDPSPPTWDHGTHAGRVWQLTLVEDTTVRVISATGPDNVSSVVTGVYTEGQPNQIDPPTLTPPSGHDLTFPFSVRISTDNPNPLAQIIYTIDGTDPTWTNGHHGGRVTTVTLAEAATIKAIVALSETELSDIVSGDYSGTGGPPPPNQWWTLVPFPFELIDEVVRGVYADALKEEGQAEKAATEEQAVPAEGSISVGSILKPPQDTLTDQIQ
jgi:hypothetical protein